MVAWANVQMNASKTVTRPSTVQQVVMACATVEQLRWKQVTGPDYDNSGRAVACANVDTHQFKPVTRAILAVHLHNEAGKYPIEVMESVLDVQFKGCAHLFDICFRLV